MKRMYGVIRIVRVLALIAVVSLWANSQSKATPLNLVPTPGGADFTAGSLGVSYSGNTFQVTTEPAGPENAVLAYNYSFQPENDFAGDFTLTATITAAGTLTSGSFTINGDMGAGYETPLLTGDLNTGADGVAFGSNLTTNGGNYATIFEFPFTVTGGDATIVSNFGGMFSMQGAVILTAYFDPGVGDVPFSGSWASNFNGLGSQDSYSDTAVVPEPSSIVLLLVGCIVCVGAHRATANKRVRLSC